MDCKEYIEMLKNEIFSDADEDAIPENEAMLNKIGNMLIESEVITEFQPDYFCGSGRRGKKVEFDGYSYDVADGTYNLFLVDDLYNTNEILNREKVDRLLSSAEEVVYCALNGKFLSWEESTAGFEVASNISRLFENKNRSDIDVDLKRIRIFIFTLKSLSTRYKNVPRPNIEGTDIAVEYSIYDANRIYDMVKSGFDKESVDICFSDFGFPEIPAILGNHKEGEYTSYLATVPGSLLAEIYKQYGTRVLESNVRAFLSVRGKVNKGIRQTILSQPEKFFLLNNGITVTANDLEVRNENGITYIKEISNMQIVNGGQTTASLANALIKDRADLSDISVMMKLSVIEDKSIEEQLVPEISKASNSQNKVDEADFFSNHPYHIRIQELSNKIMAPAQNGEQYETFWFYERVRGQYEVEQMNRTPAENKKWKKRYPKNQKITKTDWAKFLLSYEGYPEFVSKGAQTAMKKFATIIQGTDGTNGFWVEHASEIDNDYYKASIAKTILFKNTEKLVSNADWYKEIRSYRANIVTYSVAYLAYIAQQQKKDINLKLIWQKQEIYPELKEQLLTTTKEVYDFLTSDDRETQNVTEWAKKSSCWAKLKKERLTIHQSFLDTLINPSKDKKDEITNAVGNAMIFVEETPLVVWKALLEWGEKYHYIEDWKDKEVLNKVIQYHERGIIPKDKYFQDAMALYNRLSNEGFINPIS